MTFIQKTASGFDPFFRKNALLRQETTSNVTVYKSQDKSEVILDESVTFCLPFPQIHNDIDTSLFQNTFTPTKKPESDMSTMKIETLIEALQNFND